ncbi:glutathione S-transferase [Massilia sp. MB5]|uniref:glutathione S-transferase family protein n=1 Tax=Massilia sp. MB5 TaxID=2919578 RepID=UPI001F0D1387|nr:glutathione S-transferase [Massilia sp. MB5]UMR29989.1 glutathione S-transferase [Massilia sp. MB5]
MKLYYHPLSGHSHRAHLFLSLLKLDFELVLVDLLKSEHKAPDFLAKNPFGQLPLLEDEGEYIADSNAILVYLAKRYGDANWLPETPQGAAAVQRWLSVAAGEIAFGPATARIINLFKRPQDPADSIARAHRILALIESSLAGRAWIAAATPTIADVALYSYIARAPEGNVDLAAYPQVRAWLARIEALPGFAPFAKSPVGLAA